MLSEDMKFIEALKNLDKAELMMISKGDLHNHAVFSCDREYLLNNNVNIPLDQKVNNISDLVDFARKYIKPLQNDKDGLSILLNGTFKKCLETGVMIVDTNIDYKICIQVFNYNVDEFISFLKMFTYDNLKIHWVIDISRDSYLEEYEETIINLIKTGFFYGIDLTATENYQPNEKFKNIYDYANKEQLVTKVHCGEQLGADYIKQCIEDFNPKQIQHGIRIVESKEVMDLAKLRGIVFNVCPTSNLVLNHARSINEHPISSMVEYGLKVTIGTDDILLFESDINDEYLKLYENKLLTAEQLNEIRKESLNQ